VDEYAIGDGAKSAVEPVPGDRAVEPAVQALFLQQDLEDWECAADAYGVQAREGDGRNQARDEGPTVGSGEGDEAPEFA
jgi:hypothetical protein